MRNVFISHATEDKPWVLTLVEKLKNHGVQVWYDEYEINLGDSIFDKINEGLRKADFGLVVFSPAFFLKTWTRKELGALFTKEVERKTKTILPIWHNIDYKGIASQYPLLADLHAVRSNEGVAVVAQRVLQAVNASIDAERKESGVPRAPDLKADPIPDDLKNPYVGLAAFQESERHLFFGRDSVADELENQIEDHSFFAVHGASGSGKSSIIQAGLIPRLKEKGWQVVIIRPRSPDPDPLRNVVNGIVRVLYEDPIEGSQKAAELFESLESSSGDSTLRSLVPMVLSKGSSANLCFFVDQMEELISGQNPGGEESERFMTVINSLRAGGATVVVSLRSDYLGLFSGIETFASAYEDRAAKLLTPMSKTSELRAAIAEPAKLRGVGFDKGLVELLIEEIRVELGSLPLLQFCLQKLWDWHVSHPEYGQLGENAEQVAGWRWDQNNKVVMTHVGYSAIGGVRGALSRYADEFFDELNENERIYLRSILCRLVHPGREQRYDARRIARITDFRIEHQKLIQRLTGSETTGSAPSSKFRLLVTSRMPSGETAVEIIHESLIGNWSRLAGWVNERRDFLIWLDSLRTRISDWKEKGNDEGQLLRGEQLIEAKRYVKANEIEVCDDREPAAQFVSASIVADQNARLRQRRNQRIRSALTVFSILFGTLAAVFAVSTYFESQKKERESRVRSALQYRSEARVALASNAEAAALLGIGALESLESGRIGELGMEDILEGASHYSDLTKVNGGITAVNSVRDTVRDALEWIPGVGVGSHDGEVYSLGVSKSGNYIASGGTDQVINLYQMSTGNAPPVLKVRLKGHSHFINSLAFSPDDRWLASGSSDGTVRLWDLTLDEIQDNSVEVIAEGSGRIFDLAFSPSGRYLAGNAENDSIIVWNVADGQVSELQSLRYRYDDDSSLARENWIRWREDEGFYSFNGVSLFGWDSIGPYTFREDVAFFEKLATGSPGFQGLKTAAVERNSNRFAFIEHRTNRLVVWDSDTNTRWELGDEDGSVAANDGQKVIWCSEAGSRGSRLLTFDGAAEFALWRFQEMAGTWVESGMALEGNRPVTAWAVAESGKRVLVGRESEDRKSNWLILFDVSTDELRLLDRIEVVGRTMQLEFLGEGGMLLGNRNGTLRYISIADGKFEYHSKVDYRQPSAPVEIIIRQKEGQAITAPRFGSVSFWALDGPQPRYQGALSSEWPVFGKTMLLDPSERFLVAQGGSETEPILLVWDMDRLEENGEPVVLKATDTVFCDSRPLAGFSRDGRWLVVPGISKFEWWDTTKLGSLPSDSMPRRGVNPLGFTLRQHVFFSSDNRLLYLDQKFSENSPDFALLDLEKEDSGVEVLEADTNQQPSQFFPAKSENRMVSVGADGDGIWWDFSNAGETRAVAFETVPSTVGSISKISPNGKWFFAANPSESSTPLELCYLGSEGPEKTSLSAERSELTAVIQVEFSDDSRWLAFTLVSDKQVMLFRLNSEGGHQKFIVDTDLAVSEIEFFRDSEDEFMIVRHSLGVDVWQLPEKAGSIRFRDRISIGKATTYAVFDSDSEPWAIALSSDGTVSFRLLRLDDLLRRGEGIIGRNLTPTEWGRHTVEASKVTRATFRRFPLVAERGVLTKKNKSKRIEKDWAGMKAWVAQWDKAFNALVELASRRDVMIREGSMRIEERLTDLDRLLTTPPPSGLQGAAHRIARYSGQPPLCFALVQLLRERHWKLERGDDLLTVIRILDRVEAEVLEFTLNTYDKPAYEILRSMVLLTTRFSDIESYFVDVFGMIYELKTQLYARSQALLVEDGRWFDYFRKSVRDVLEGSGESHVVGQFYCRILIENGYTQEAQGLVDRYINGGIEVSDRVRHEFFELKLLGELLSRNEFAGPIDEPSDENPASGDTGGWWERQVLALSAEQETRSEQLNELFSSLETRPVECFELMGSLDLILTSGVWTPDDRESLQVGVRELGDKLRWAKPEGDELDLDRVPTIGAYSSAYKNRVLQNVGDYEASLDALNQVIFSVDQTDFLRLKARGFRAKIGASMDPERALEELETVNTLIPNKDPIWKTHRIDLARVLLRLERDEEAVAVLDGLLSDQDVTEEDILNAKIAKSWALVKLDQLQAARSLASDVADDDQKATEVQRLRAILLMVLIDAVRGDTESLERQYQMLASVYPENANSFLARAVCDLFTGKAVEASRMIGHAIETIDKVWMIDEWIIEPIETFLSDEFPDFVDQSQQLAAERKAAIKNEFELAGGR